MFDVDWEKLALLLVGLVGYWHLVRVAKRRYVLGLVQMYVGSVKKDESGEYPIQKEIYSKSCPFLVTPVPGMEFLPADIESAEILRVKIDDDGFLEVICELEVSGEENEFEETCRQLEADGWRKKIYV